MQENSTTRRGFKTLLLGALFMVVAGCGDGDSNPSGSAADADAATRGSVSTEAAAIPIGTAANYAILAKTGVSTAPLSAITGNIGLSPAARVFLTG